MPDDIYPGQLPEYWGSARQKLLYLLGSVFSFALHFPNLAWRWTFFSKLLHESNKLIDLRFRFFHFASDVPKVIPFIERVRDLICNDIKSHRWDCVPKSALGHPYLE